MSSIGTPTLSNWQAKKLLKTKVKICGRFLMPPDEQFGVDAAAKYIRNATEDKIHLKTVLRVYDVGIQFGQKGVLSSMPLEFIKYHRIAGFVSLKENTTLLAVCVRDHNQKTVTIVRFRDSECLRIVTEVVDKQKRLLLEDPAIKLQSDLSLNDKDLANWSLKPHDEVESQDQTDRKILSKPIITVPPSKPQNATTVVTTKTTNYYATDNHNTKENPIAVDIHEDDDYAIIIRNSTTGQKETAYHSNIVASKTQPPHHQHIPQTAYVVNGSSNNNRHSTEIDCEILNYDELEEKEVFANFETIDGPPTLLNEHGAIRTTKHKTSDHDQVEVKYQKNVHSIPKRHTVEYSRHSTNSYDKPKDVEVIRKGEIKKEIRAQPDGSFVTNTVIYREEPQSQQPSNVTYVNYKKAQSSPTTHYNNVNYPVVMQAHTHPAPQQQLVKLIPVGNSARSPRPRSVQHVHQIRQPGPVLYALQPVSTSEEEAHYHNYH